jgi:branched-chain amino acid transport system permease protein
VQSFLVATLNGLSYGLLLFMLSAGLTLIFSMLGVLNFAHASFYMLGAYIGRALAQIVGFWPALVLAPVAVAVAGAILERGLLRRARPHGQRHELLLTFGVAYLVAEAVKLVWGLGAWTIPIPASLDGPLFVFDGAAFTRYRAFVAAVALVTLAVLYALLRGSRVGLVLRAALTHPQAVQALGHDVPRIGNVVFALGTGLAALAGVVGAPLAVVEPGMAEAVGSIVFVVVIVGGLGSLGGAFAASLVIACLQTFAATSAASFDTVLAPLARFGLHLAPAWGALSMAQLAPLAPYLVLVAVLVCRPHGLFGERSDEA